MNIIFIHGMNQQHQSQNALKQAWLTHISRSLNPTQYSNFLQHNHFECAFYGDLLIEQHLNNKLHFSSTLEENQSIQPKPQSNPHINLNTTSTTLNQSTAVINNTIPVSEFALQWKDQAIRDFLMLINFFPKLHNSLIHHFLIETYLYLNNPEFTQQVHQRISDTILDPNQEYAVIGHSLGSVIAYNYLREHPKLKFKFFMSLGSPLAFRIIQSQVVHPIQRPESLKGDWFNIYSLNDFLAAFPLMQQPFNFSPKIINLAIHTSAFHPHEIGHYLENPDVTNLLTSQLNV